MKPLRAQNDYPQQILAQNLQKNNDSPNMAQNNYRPQRMAQNLQKNSDSPFGMAEYTNPTYQPVNILREPVFKSDDFQKSYGRYNQFSDASGGVTSYGGGTVTKMAQESNDEIDYLRNAYDRVIEILQNSVHVGLDEKEWQLARFKCNLLIENFGLQLEAVKITLKTLDNQGLSEKLDKMKKDFQEDESLPRDFRDKAKDLIHKFLCLLQNKPIQYDKGKKNPQISMENLKVLIYLSQKGLKATDKFQNGNLKHVFYEALN